MNKKNYRYVRMGIAAFMCVVMSLAISMDNTWLAVASVVVGMVFSVLARSKSGVQVDERGIMIRQKAAQMAYAIFAPTIGLGSVLFILLAKDEFYFLEAIGIVLAYLTIFLIALYSISLFYFNRKFGGDGKE